MIKDPAAPAVNFKTNNKAVTRAATSSGLNKKSVSERLCNGLLVFMNQSKETGLLVTGKVFNVWGTNLTHFFHYNGANIRKL